MNGNTRRVLCFAAALAVASSTGCRFRELKHNLVDLESLATLRGSVASVSTEPAPIVVVLMQDEGDLRTLHDYVVLREDGEFEFRTLPGSFFLGAFEDTDQNLRRDPDELAAFYGEATRLDVVAEAVVDGLDIRLESTLVGDVEDHIGPFSRELPLFKRDLGEVVRIDDERFAPERGEDGLWAPVDFLYTIGGGIYFTQEYEPKKIPVLFVHGASGTPRDFADLIAGLDKKRYQPWLFFYPSGMRLGRIGPYLHELVEELHGTLGFDRLFVVAHSMGGLVARSYLNTYSADPGAERYVQRFVSISTPWAGHKMAASGVKYAPEVVPSWRDMAPDSEFLAQLFETGLPEGVPHHLFFGYKGDRGDGTIKLTSQLAPEAQYGASRVLGFEEDHMSILANADVLAALHEALAAP